MNRIENLHQVVEQINLALLSPQIHWEKLDDLPGAQHFSATGHPVWIFHLLCGEGFDSIGTAMDTKAGVVVKLTPAQTRSAERVAKAATHA